MADYRVPGRFPGPPGATPPLPPQLNGKLAASANAVVVGPLRALHGNQPRTVQIPGTATTSQFQFIAGNDQPSPKIVRIRLARNGTEGRIALSREQSPGGISVGGVLVPTAAEWIDLMHADRKYECLLNNGDRLFGIGTWPGMVPLSVWLTVLEWSP